MKTFLKVIGIVIVILIAFMFAIPFVFHKQIIDTALREANKQVEAKINFDDYSLSLFRSFPNFNLGIEGLSIANKGEFAGDTLAKIKSFEVSIGLFSVFKGDQYEVRKIELTDPVIHLKARKDGSVNWDIMAAGDEETQETTETEASGDFMLRLKKLQINGGKFTYEDESSGMKLMMNGLDHSLGGDFAADFTSMSTNTRIHSFNFIYDGIRYVDDASVSINAGIDADLKNEIYTLKDNEISINELVLRFAGSVSMLKDAYNLTLTFEAPDNKFRNLLSLVPAIYKKDFENIETKGTVTINGSVKGLYQEDKLPEFNFDLLVEDAMFHYPDLPQSVEDIFISTQISNPGGSADNTIVDVKKFKMQMAGNPIDMRLFLKTPVSDPYVDAKLNAVIDLNNLDQFYPLDTGEELQGTIESNMSFKGNLSTIEKEQYEDFMAMGSMYVNNVTYKSGDLPESVKLQLVQMNFSPSYLDLVNLKMQIGKSNLNARGKLENYLGYVFKNDTIRGSLTTSSSYLDLNELMPDGEAVESSVEQTDTASLEIFEVPRGIEFDLQAEIGQLLFRNYDMKNILAEVIIKNEEVLFRNLKGDLFGGSIRMNGKYSTKENQKPRLDIDLDVADIKMSEAVNSMSFMKHYAPVLEKASGNVSTGMNISGLLQNDYMPVYASLNGSGFLKIMNAKLENSKTLNTLSDKLNVDLFRQMEMNMVNLSFNIKDGKLNVEPFDVKMGRVNGEISGYTSFDQSIDYTMDLDVPRGSFGKEATDQLNQFLSDS
ncbi:MAG: AsmA family protein, partial [Bacteroidales bacterium]|nr:AsmA family protein [Bacteroidales bacterium]